MKLLILESGAGINQRHIVGVWPYQFDTMNSGHHITVETTTSASTGESIIIRCGSKEYRDAVLGEILGRLKYDHDQIKVADIKASYERQFQPAEEVA